VPRGRGWAGYVMMPHMMFHETASPSVSKRPSPASSTTSRTTRVERTRLVTAGLRNPAKAVQTDGGNVLPVMMIEACSTKYSGPILREDTVRSCPS